MNRTFVIAEAGVNHNGSLDLAKELIKRAAEAGADAVKFQTFTAASIISRHAEKADYQKKNTGSEESQLEMVRRLELSEAMHEEIVACCRENCIQFLSSPFDSESVDLLANKIRVDQIKIPSGEITNAPLLLKVAQTGLPVLLSTGMATLGEIEEALGVLAFGYVNKNGSPSMANFQNAYVSNDGQNALQSKVTLLHCTTEYPSPFEEVNLKAMDTLKAAFQLRVGFSDHTEGIAIPIVAVGRGATVIEKHFTIDRTLPGPDHKASLEPQELKAMITAIRQVELAVGSGIKRPSPTEQKNKEIVRKSLVAGRVINRGEMFSEANLACKRPGTGVSPMKYWEFLGKQADRSYTPDEKIER
ncbi:N-acetylneuraminate synthase [Brevibacillus borstelensis]|uniref:N-acetylneuraminate synthase n=1 Tax=Brevibacillus borstelensis TaxID=45462 RepID=UPI00203A7EE9|nr:N-acetylneuraminate synthase [Brevibacillus borstelensis]MCM3590174.1 N-acetylneuraminate synthase [Brevibacillus borstelensis]